MNLSGRAWTAVSIAGIALWIGVTVLVGVADDDPAGGTPTVTAFIAGGAVFFSTIFAVALVQQLRLRPETAESRLGKRLAIGYTLTGTVVTALGLGAVWLGSGGDDGRVLLYPLIAIVVVWAGIAIWALRRYGAL